MQQITITEKLAGQVEGVLIRMNGKFILSGYHLGKELTREEGLALKNKYGMKPYSSYGVSLGYKGIIPREEFIGGKMYL